MVQQDSEAKEAIHLLTEIATLLNTGLDTPTIQTLVVSFKFYFIDLFLGIM